MLFGIILYEFAYVLECDKVCITAMNEFILPKLYLYSREELHELDTVWRGIVPLYYEALKHFPKENKNERQ